MLPDSTNPRVMADNIKELDARSLTTADEVSALQIYDTDETDTGKKWIDGSAIYRKVIDIGDIEAATASTTAHEISNLGIVIDYKLIAITDSAFMYPIIASSASYVRQVVINDTNVVIKSATNAPALTDVYAIIEYTKTPPTP